MISTPRRRVHVYTEKENETPKVFSNTARDHDGVKNNSLHRTPLADINGQKLANGDQLKRCLITATSESYQTPGERKERRSLKLACVKQRLGQSKHDVREEEDDKIPHEAQNILTKKDNPTTGSSLSSFETNSTTSETSHSSISCDDFVSATFNLISSSVEPIHCNSSSVISLTSINSDEEESQQHDESLLIEMFVGDVISKAQRIVLEELGSSTASNESNQSEKQLHLLQFTERDDIDMSSTEEQQTQSQELNFPEMNIIKAEIAENSDEKSFMHSCFEESKNKEEEFLELVNIRSSPALEDVLESSGDERLLVYEDSCLSQDLKVGVEDVSKISLQNFFQLQQEMTEGEDETHANLLLQLTPSKILNNAPQIIPVFRHAVFAKSEYEVALCSGNLWQSETKTNKVVTTPVRFVECGTLTSPRLLLSSSNDSVTETDGFTDLKNTERGSDNPLTTPVILQTNNSYLTSPLSLTDHSQMTTPVRGVNEETSMTPTCLHVRSCNTSPVRVTDQSTVMSPLEVKYQSCNTSPIEKFSKETETVHPSTQDAAVGESVVTTNENCTQMTPSQSHDKECSTSPLTVCNVSQMTTPVSSEDAETCTSPLSTSPLRLSSFSRKSENSMALMEQMKSSHISNKLLRREVSSLKKHRTLWEEHLQKEQQEMRKNMYLIKNKEMEIHQAKQAVKASVQSEIDDLLTQVGQQLAQIGDLEHNVQQKNEEITKLMTTNEERKKKYCDEVKELQEDLCLTYKQHEMEVADLKDKVEKQSSYEKLYHKSMEKNKMLEEEVHAFTQLKETLMKATEIQERMPIVSETFTVVRSLFQQTLAEKTVVQIKQKELNEKEDELLKKIQKSSEETQLLMRETERLQEVVEEERKKFIFVETERERLQDELVTSQQENNCLQKSLKEALEEIETLKSDVEGLGGEITRLKDAELLVKATQQEIEDKLVSEISDVRNTNLEMKEKIDEMNETKKRLTNELETMKAKYTEAMQNEDSLKVQLKNEEESKEFMQTEFDSMEEYAKELEAKVKTIQEDLDNCKTPMQESQNAIKNYEMMIQNIREHFMSCQNELEHTKQKAHHMIMHQGAQISSASDALQDLTNRLIQSFPGIESDAIPSLQKTKNPTSQIEEEILAEGNILSSSSFVFSILNSPLMVTERPELCSKENILNASSVSSHTQDSNGPAEYSSSQLQERNLIGQSANSAFSRVHPASSSREEADLSIGEHVQKVNDLFNLLTEKIFNKMQISNQNIQHLEARSDQLMKDLQKSRKQYDSYILQLQNQLQDSELQVRHLRQELQTACSRTYDDQEKLHRALRESQAAELCNSQNTEKKLTILRMQKEIEKLVKELKVAEHNKQMYQEQVTSLTSLISDKGSSDIKQTMALLSKISADHTKLKKEMRIVEENWQKAEVEVKSLDSLFQHCVKLLEKVPLHVRNNDRNLQTLTGILLSP